MRTEQRPSLERRRVLGSAGTWLRAATLVVLLAGQVFQSAYTSLGGPHAYAAPVAAVLIVYEVVRCLPRLHPVVLFVVPVFLTFYAHMAFHSPTDPYGVAKVNEWITATLVVALSAALIRDRRTFRAFAILWSATGIWLAFLALSSFDRQRAGAFDSNPLALGRVLAVAIVLLLWLKMTDSLNVPWLAVGAGGLVLFVGLLATGSRGPLLSSLLGAAMLVWLAGGGRAWKIGAAAGCAALLALDWALSSDLFSGSRITVKIDPANDDGTRQEMWRVSWDMIGDPFFGVGVGQWQQHAGARFAHAEHPHNLFVEVFAEYGIVYGVALVVLVLWVLVKAIERARVSSLGQGVAALFVVLLFNNVISGTLNQRFFWFTLTLAFLSAVGALGDDAPGPKPRRATVPGRTSGKPPAAPQLGPPRSGPETAVWPGQPQ